MKIIDSQLHEPAPLIEWPHDAESRVQLGVELTVAMMDSVGVSGAVLATSRPEYVNAAIKQFPERFASLLEWELEPGDPRTMECVSAVRDEKGAIGLRLLPTWPPENAEKFRSGAFDDFFAAAQSVGLPVSLLVSGILKDMPRIARKFPDLPLVVDHFGHNQPPFQERDDVPLAHLADLLSLKEYPNVSVKISGGPALSFEPYPFSDLHAPIKKIVDAFGPSRLMWGSDITRINAVLRCPAISDEDYRDTADYPGKHNYAESLFSMLHTLGLSQDEKVAIFGGTLREVFGWH